MQRSWILKIAAIANAIVLVAMFSGCPAWRSPERRSEEIVPHIHYVGWGHEGDPIGPIGPNGPLLPVPTPQPQDKSPDHKR